MPLQIRTALASEVGGVNPGLGNALALAMVVVVVVVMTAYALVQRRAAKWKVK